MYRQKQKMRDKNEATSMLRGGGVEEVVMATAMHGDITSKITKMFNKSEQYGNLAKQEMKAGDDNDAAHINIMTTSNDDDGDISVITTNDVNKESDYENDNGKDYHSEQEGISENGEVRRKGQGRNRRSYLKKRNEKAGRQENTND